MTTLTEKRPWYQEPYVWFIIALPGSAIIAGLFTLYLAIISYDGLVVDDYYKQGLAINKRLEKEQSAITHGLAAQVQIEKSNIRIFLDSKSDYVLPNNINVLLSHGTRQGFDQEFELTKTDAMTYSGKLEPLVPGHWNVILEQDDWRIIQSVHLR